MSARFFSGKTFGMRAAHLVTLLIVPLEGMTVAVGNEAEDLEARWRREYPPAARQLERLTRDFFAEGRFRYRRLNGVVQDTNRLTIAAADGEKKLVVRDERTTRARGSPVRREIADVFCRTPDYQFYLEKMPGSENWIIKAHEASKTAFIDLDFYFDNLARGTTCFLQESLLERLESGKLKIIRMRDVTNEGDNLVQMEYEYEGPQKSETGSIYLDEDFGWAIRRVEVVSVSEAIPYIGYSATIECGRTAEGLVYPISTEYYVRTASEDSYEHVDAELTRIESGPSPDAVFRLSGYGLPEIPVEGTTRKTAFRLSNPWLWVSLAAAIVCLILARSWKPGKAM